MQRHRLLADLNDKDWEDFQRAKEQAGAKSNYAMVQKLIHLWVEAWGGEEKRGER